MPGKGRVPCSGQGRVPLVEQDECACLTSELGKSFWRNVRLGNIQCEFDERAPSGLWKAYEKEDGTLLTGSYYPRPSTKPLDCDLTKSGFIRLRFRAKGAPAGEDKPVNLKVPWDYIGHGQNRDSMLGKIGQPWVSRF